MITAGMYGYVFGIAPALFVFSEQLDIGNGIFEETVKETQTHVRQTLR